jgi:hypothetical protein
MSTDAKETISRPQLKWYHLRARVVGGVGAFLFLLLAVAFGFWVHERWATAYVRAAGATVQHSRKGGYVITLARDRSASLVFNRDLTRLNSLRDDIWLHADGTDAKDRDLVYLDRLERLEFLGLANTRITDAGIPQLARLPALWKLDLSGTDVTDDGVRGLKVSRINDLSLAGTKVTDRCLEFLPFQRQICQLDISNTGITDRAIPKLVTLQIRYLNVSGTKISDKGIETLRKALPGCAVEWWTEERLSK